MIDSLTVRVVLVHSASSSSIAGDDAVPMMALSLPIWQKVLWAHLESPVSLTWLWRYPSAVAVRSWRRVG